MEEDKFGKLISKKEAALILDVSEKTLQRLASKKEIIVIYKKKFHGGKIAYFPLSEVERIKLAWENKEPLPIVEIPLLEVEEAEEAEEAEKAENQEMVLTSESINDTVSDAKMDAKEVEATKALVKSPVKVPVKAIAKKEISAVEVGAKLILTVYEVTILTHIPEKELREDLKKGKLRGLFKGHGWKVKRADLEDYVRSIYVPRRTDVIEDSGTNEIDLGDLGEIESWEG
ncbi:MAG: hypothetical protein FD167_3965 [bacterium]|nr:MAG: hypothetical protein FD167_3965 [bacterium]